MRIKPLGMVCALATTLLGLGLPARGANGQGSGNGEYFKWVVRNANWSAEDEKAYEDTIRRIGEAVEGRYFNKLFPNDQNYARFAGKCLRLEDCMHDASINPLFLAADRDIAFEADCSKLAHLVRAYVAWKRHLPFSFANEGEARFGDGIRLENGELEIRYTKGNRIKSRYNIVPTADRPFDIKSVASNILNNVSSTMFRVLYDRSADRLPPDLYEAAISETAIKPGTIIYDPDGHVVVVYKVDSSGRIWYVDSHPDKSLSIGLFGQKFARGGPWTGAGFKRFRPVELRGATASADGSLVGGVIHVGGSGADAVLDDYTKYVGNVAPLPRMDGWRTAKFSIAPGANVPYVDFVRARVTGAVRRVRINPRDEVASQVFGICLDAQARVEAVTKGQMLASRQHPAQLPNNIYGTTPGDWEDYSTPSRDARLKASFIALRESVAGILTRQQARDNSIEYTGANLKADMLDEYRHRMAGCRINYRNSRGSMVNVTLLEVARRLSGLSFDPYHCPELRWGAKGQELASCPSSSADDQVKMRWYAAEQHLRNQPQRNYDKRMGYTLDQLEAQADVRQGVGLVDAPDVCIERVLGGSCG